MKKLTTLALIAGTVGLLVACTSDTDPSESNCKIDHIQDVAKTQGLDKAMTLSQACITKGYQDSMEWLQDRKDEAQDVTEDLKDKGEELKDKGIELKDKVVDFSKETVEKGKKRCINDSDHGQRSRQRKGYDYCKK